MTARDRALLEEIAILEELERRERQRLFYKMFPDVDTKHMGRVFHARESYGKHLEFFEAGATYRERCAMAANRVGKTLGMGGYETAAHLTGLYRDWWPGRRFTGPIRAWASGKTNETTRDIVQTTLLGEITVRDGRKSFSGTGVIPGDCIGKVTWKQGVQDLADTVKIKNAFGGWSTLGMKSYQQGRGSFEGTAQDLIWLDEEPPLSIYGECLIRTATTDGLVMLTFTPLEGMSETVMQFLARNEG